MDYYRETQSLSLLQDAESSSKYQINEQVHIFFYLRGLGFWPMATYISIAKLTSAGTALGKERA